MSYQDVAELQQSSPLLLRLIAAVWQERESASADKWDGTTPENPVVEATGDAAGWVQANHWRFAAQPGWAAAWASGKAAFGPGGGSEDPEKFNNLGAQPDVISDSMILGAVQAIHGGYA